MNQVLTIGHRGAKAHAPENTIASFEKAIEMGVDMIELDIQISKDFIPMVIHDDTVDRTTTATGKVSEFTCEDLQLLGIPTLQEVLEFVQNRCGLIIEIKVLDAIYLVHNLIKSLEYPLDNLIVSSFNWEVIMESRLMDNKINVAITTESNIMNTIKYAKIFNLHSIHADYHLLTKEVMKSINQKKIKVFAWTVNNPYHITFVKKLRVDGIITDYPERV